MFDHDFPFDEAGLAVLADSVVGFEDVIAAVHEDTGRFTNLDRLVKRIEQQDAALERRLAEEPPQMAVSQEILADVPLPEPPRPPNPRRRSRRSACRSRHCCRAGPVPSLPSATSSVLPKIPAPAGTEGRPPYLESAEPPPAGATPAAARPQASASARSEDYDPEVASIFSEEATELLESADSATRRAEPSVAAASRSPSCSACCTPERWGAHGGYHRDGRPEP